METNKEEILKVLKAALKGTYFTRFTYYITAFECELLNDTLAISADFMLSEFEIEDKTEWNKWVQSYPLNIENFNGPEEPARVFLMGLLTQASIQDVEEENEGTLIFTFQNNMRIRIQGEDEMADNSWNLRFKNADGIEIGNCNCSFNEMFLTVSEELSDKLRATQI
jgi:hypothetical protein